MSSKPRHPEKVNKPINPFKKKELADRIKKGFDLIKKKIPNDLDFYLGFDKNLTKLNFLFPLTILAAPQSL